MAQDATDLVNTALVRLGQPRITSLADDTSNRAVLARQFYAGIRDAVLEDKGWNEATARATLVTTTAPTWGFSNAFALPADFLRLIHVREPDTEYRVEGKTIVTDLDEFHIRYVKRLEDVSQMSRQLQDAISKRLSAELAKPLTGSDLLSRQNWQLYQDALDQAKDTDAQQGQVDQVAGSSWLNSRHGAEPSFRPIADATS
jgi:hypothetical protein